MSIVKYRCDTCKREIELQRNVEGLERIQRCVITHGCRGKLFQEKVLPDYIRRALPKDVSGLENWQQRKVLHNHNQPIEQDEWKIAHNMGTFPTMSVYVNRPIQGDEDNVEELIPQDTIVVDENNVTLKFERPYSGIAQLVSQQSDPNLLNPFVRVEEEIAEATQISNKGEITVATKVKTIGTNSDVSLKVEFATANGTTPEIDYVADDQPSVYSAWSTEDLVYIKNELYTIRSFNALTPEMTSGVINSGATFIFNGIDKSLSGTFDDINVNDVFIMLASSPFETVDKLYDQLIDISRITGTTNQFALYYYNGEFYAQPEVVDTIYPHVTLR